MPFVFEQLHFEPEEALPLPDIISLRLADRSLFHSEKDISIAQDIFGRVREQLKSQEISVRQYEQVLQSLELLLPSRDENGFRSIADITLNPEMERLIESRIESAEINIYGKEHIWGSLPRSVRRAIFSKAIIDIEITDKCTVACPFCGVSKKGHINQKLSFSSIVNFLREKKATPAEEVPFFYGESFFSGSDPFDAKWQKSRAKENDYSDLAIEFWKIFSREKALFTSTAVPIGEEWRILNFALTMIPRYLSGELHPETALRFSLTEKNQLRVEAILKIIETLYRQPKENLGIVVNNLLQRGTVPTGESWKNNNPIKSLVDIVGISCMDNLIVSPRGVDLSLMMPHSNEFPSGELRHSFCSTTKDGKSYYIPQAKWYGGYNWDTILGGTLTEFPKFTVIRERNGRLKKQEFQDKENPQRAFFRIVALLLILSSQHKYNPGKISSSELTAAKVYLKKEIALVEDYLATGAENISMQQIMRDFFPM